MNRPSMKIIQWVMLCGFVAIASAQQAQSPRQEPQPADRDSTTEATSQTAPPVDQKPATLDSAEQVQQQMQQLLSDNPQFNTSPSQAQTQQTARQTTTHTPSSSASTGTASSSATPFMPSLDLDVDVLGIPPGDQQPQLRREGEFVINRRGRLARSPSGTRLLFVFEADSDAAPEPPMPILPCQILENMEDLSNQRSDQVVFILSGQVTLYRGVNFLLPTMMKLAIDRGNIRN